MANANPDTPRLADEARVSGVLRRLTLGEDHVSQGAIADDLLTPKSLRSEKARLLVQLAAMLAVDADEGSLRPAVARVRRAGASEAEIADVLVTAAPAIGLAGVVSAAPRLAAALGHEVGDEVIKRAPPIREERS